LTTKSGEPVGALFGFARMLRSLQKNQKPDFIAVCFDTPEKTFRHEKFEEYKATRVEIDESLVTQLDIAEDLVKAMGLPTAAAPGYEADDLLATLARRGVKQGLRVVLVTGDKDAMQLVDDDIQVWNEARQKLFDADAVFEKMNVRPDQIVDYLAIVGDASDNVPGVPGIGAKGAAKLLGEFGTLDKIIKAAHKGHQSLKPKATQSLVDNEKAALESRELIELHEKVPVDLKPKECVFRIEDPASTEALLSRLEFHSLRRELLGGDGAATAPEAPDAAGVSVSVKRADAKKVLDAAIKAKRVTVSVEAPAQADLLSAGTPVVAIALADGRTAAFTDAAFTKHAKGLEKLFKSARPLKDGFDLKAARRRLGEAGMAFEGIGDDAYVAAYCLDPSRGKYELESLAAERGAGEPPADAADAACWRAAAAASLCEVLLEEVREAGLEKLYRDVELPVVRVLSDMELRGVFVDPAYLKKLRKEFESRIASLQKEIDKLAGVEINLRSTKQLAELLYEKLELPVSHKTPKGAPSTDEDALRALADEHPVPAKIIDYREVTKLQSTYVIGLLDKIDAKTGRVHSHFNQAGTATGRLSSTDPNLQNIPIRTELGRKIRAAVRAEKGKVLLAADYSQIDLRVLAHLSGDEALRESFRSGGDIHRRTAAEVFGVAPDEVDKAMRGAAKAVNFGIVYGQSAHGLAGQLGITRPEAAEYIKKYKERYPGVTEWMKETLEAAKRDLSVKTLLGRIRPLPDIRAKNFQVRAFNERVAINTPIQGTSADIIKAAMLSIYAERPEAELILQVHDELVFEIPKGNAKAFSRWVREKMEKAVRLEVPVVVDVKIGTDWNDMENAS
jgi:DNA polymerase-1